MTYVSGINFDPICLVGVEFGAGGGFFSPILILVAPNFAKDEMPKTLQEVIERDFPTEKADQEVEAWANCWFQAQADAVDQSAYGAQRLGSCDSQDI